MNSNRLAGTKADKFTQAIEDNYRMVRAFLRSLGVDQSNVDDMAQETFLTAFKALDKFEEGRPFGPWFRGIAKRRFFEHCREMKGKDLALGDELIDAIDAEFAVFDSRGEAGEQDLFTALEGCLGKLDGDSERMLRLFYYEAKSSQEVAEACGLNDATVRKRLQRMRAELAECLKKSLAK